MSEQLSKAHKKATKSHEVVLKKAASSSPKDHFHHQHQQSRKQPRKTENPVRIPPPSPEPGIDSEFSDSSICKNSACRAALSAEDTFCKRCSCCICHLFDDNKDPSLWLECDSCGLSCHVQCALERGKVGVVDLGLLMRLDGSYCCASCGNVSGILECWKKQLSIAKDSRRVDVLCHRIFLSYRLLDGSSRFNELHEIVRDAKAKLETEVGPVDGDSSKMARGIVGRLSVAVEVQRLCSLAVEKADQFIASKSTSTINLNVIILLIELSTALDADIKGYKLWYCKSRNETYPSEPVFVFPRHQKRICISNLQPSTEYSFRITSYTDTGDFGHSESNFLTNSLETMHKNSNPNTEKALDIESDSGFKVRDLGRILNLTWIQEHGIFDSFDDDSSIVKLEEEEKLPSIDLNVASVPDLNEECTDDALSQEDIHRAPGEVPAVDSDNSTLTMTTTNDVGLDENFEYCVKIIRWLECEGHIRKEFRLRLLTWLSLRSTEQERRVVNTFIQTMIDDPSSLAGQLVDSFSDVASKKQRNGVFS
ncbi:vin3-like protein 1 [Phtheirospermum japonicum]|uniref:Vin3-like protein 1 n=1 Tax=Phtheirospermum japonicum TaxID=374723 RepID=A0A830B1F1_9LAMI|nr:vin3-like protein 1 [Phtheirospermum japonicum]